MNGDISISPGAQQAQQLNKTAKELGVSPENAAEALLHNMKPTIEVAPSSESTLAGDMAKLKEMGKEVKHELEINLAPAPKPQLSEKDALLADIMAHASGKGLVLVGSDKLKNMDPAFLEGFLQTLQAGKLSENGLDAGIVALNGNQMEALNKQGMVPSDLNAMDNLADLRGVIDAIPPSGMPVIGVASSLFANAVPPAAVPEPEPSLFEAMTQNPTPRPKGSIGAE